MECSVKVERRDGWGAGGDVFVNGNYVDAAGKVGIAFRVESGRNTFETMAGGIVAWQRTQSIDCRGSAATITVVLEPATTGGPA